MDTLTLSALAFTIVLLLLIRRWVACPPDLLHLPRLPLGPLLWSYFSGEPEAERVKRLLLPFANNQGEGLVLVWALGDYMVHILDFKLAKELMENRLILKQPPNKDMLFWRFTGDTNIFFTEGEVWKRQSAVVRNALRSKIPVDQFVTLSKTLMSLMGNGGRLCWSEYTHRFTLDAVGTTILGHDFESLEKPNGSFVQEYHDVMSEISNPLFVAFPSLERWFPRKTLIRKMDALVGRFMDLLAMKRQEPGDDYITYMLSDPGMSQKEHRDNIVSLFMAGHDTTAGSLSTLVYYFAKYPQYQQEARSEVLSVIGPDREPSIDDLDKMPFLHACVREAMRLNSPSTITIPRVSPSAMRLGKYVIPPNTPVVLNIHGVLHNEETWPNQSVFMPERFLSPDKTKVAIPEDGRWMPFGAGHRRCPALSFALYEQRTCLAMLLRAYEWSLPEDSPHADGLKCAFSAFALSLPLNLNIDFVERR